MLNLDECITYCKIHVMFLLIDSMQIEMRPPTLITLFQL